MLQRIQKETGGKLEAKVIPNIQSVKERKTDSLKNKIEEQKIYDSGMALVESLKEEYDLSTIAHKLASMLTNETYVKGNNYIGKSQNDIKRLFDRLQNERSGDRNSRSRGRGNNNRNRSRNSRNRRDGNKGSRSRNSRRA